MTDKNNKQSLNADTQSLSKPSKVSDLIVEGDALQLPDAEQAKNLTSPEQAEVLNQALNIAIKGTDPKSDSGKAWLIARNKIERFKPLPWFLWRLSKSVFSKPPGLEEINEGMLLGLRRLVFAAASDPQMGVGDKINNLKKALSILTPDTIAAVAVIHSVCKRLSGLPNEGIWRSILDDALIASQIGHQLGSVSDRIGKGRAMLSGFAVNAGLAILIATGDSKQAQEVFEQASGGMDLNEACLVVYGCEQIHISAVLLASCGCSPDAAAGISQSQLTFDQILDLKQPVLIWTVSHKILQSLSKSEEADDHYYDLLKIDQMSRDDLLFKAKKIVRSGSSWGWIA